MNGVIGLLGAGPEVSDLVTVACVMCEVLEMEEVKYL